MPAAAADGALVAWFDLGGDGPALVMAHANGFHGRVWQPVAGELTDRYRCVAFDHRGHGDTPPPPGPPSWEGFALDALAVVDAVGAGAGDPVLGLGHSGGATALLLAEALRPGTFAALYCYEPVAFPRPGPGAEGSAAPPAVRMAAAARRRRDRFASRRQAYDHFASRSPLAALAPAALRAYVDHGLADAGDGGVRLKCRPEQEAAVYGIGPGHEAWDRLAEVACPVTVAAGDQPGSFGPGAARAQAGRLPRGRPEVIAGLGHLGPLEDPARVAGSVRRAFGP